MATRLRTAPKPLSRRHTLKLLLGATLALGSASCRRPQPRLTLWHPWEGTRLKPLFQTTLDRFHDNNPNLEITSKRHTHTTLRQALIDATRTQSLPDIFALNTSWFKLLGGTQNLTPLDPLLASHSITLAKILAPRKHNRCLHQNQPLAIPAVSVSGLGILFQNISLSPDPTPPKNWADFTEKSRTLVQSLNTPDELRIIALDPYIGISPTLFLLLMGKQIPITNPTERHSLLNSPEILAIAEQLETYIQRVYGPWGGHQALLRWRLEVAGTDQSALTNPFAHSHQAYALGGHWGLGQFLSLNPKLKIITHPIPGIDNAHGISAAHHWAYAINPRTPHPELAWKLLHHLTLAPEGIGQFCADQARISPVIAQNQSPLYDQWGPTWQNIQNIITHDIPYPTSIHTELFTPLLANLSFRRVKGDSTHAIISDFHQRFQNLLDQENSSAGL